MRNKESTQRQKDFIKKLKKELGYEIDEDRYKTSKEADALIKELMKEQSKRREQKNLVRAKKELFRFCSILGLDYDDYEKEFKSSKEIEAFLEKELKKARLSKEDLKNTKPKFKKPDKNDLYKNILYYYNKAISIPNFSEMVKDISDEHYISNMDSLFKEDLFYEIFPKDIKESIKKDYMLNFAAKKSELAKGETSYEGKELYLAIGSFYKTKEGGVEGIPFFVIPFRVFYSEDEIAITQSKNEIPYFNPYVLEPWANKKSNTVIIGNTEKIENFKPDFFKSNLWKEYIEKCDSFFSSITGSSLRDHKFEYGGIERKTTALVIEAEEAQASARNILNLHLYLSYSKNFPKLLKNIFKPSYNRESNKIYKEVLTGSHIASAHIDTTKENSREAFPLDPSQREALVMYTKLGDGEVLAVNGPPGTGKTSMLKSIIATAFLQKTISCSDYPPLIIACGATNQSVTNIIESFADFAKEGHDSSIYSRWIKGIHSYGWYFPASSRESDESVQKYQLLISKGKNIELGGKAAIFGGYIKYNDPEEFEDFYLERFNDAFDKEIDSVQKAGSYLLEEIKRLLSAAVEIKKLVDMDKNGFLYLNETGKRVLNILENINKDFKINDKYTSKIESILDEVENGKIDYFEAVELALSVIPEDEMPDSTISWEKNIDDKLHNIENICEPVEFTDNALPVAIDIYKDKELLKILENTKNDIDKFLEENILDNEKFDGVEIELLRAMILMRSLDIDDCEKYLQMLKYRLDFRVVVGIGIYEDVWNSEYFCKLYDNFINSLS